MKFRRCRAVRAASASHLSAVRAGHGLDSLVQRLDALFGTKGRLNVVRREGYSVVEMIVPVS